MKYRNVNFRIPQPEFSFVQHRLIRWLPSRGNVIFTLLMIALLVAAQSVGALPLGRPLGTPNVASTGTIAYQGRLADSAGAPLTGTYNMIFRLYDAAASGTPLWEEQWTGSNGVRVSDGLFNVMLGSLTTMSQDIITGHDPLFLGITVGTDDEMAPRVQLGSVPFAVQALTVPDGSVTTAKIANGAVTTPKINLMIGNVGIGTAQPGVGGWGARLDVVGTIRAQNGGLSIWDTTDNKTWGLYYEDQNDYFYVDEVGAGRRLVIKNGGNVGIGTTDPGARLDVNGSFRATGTKSAVVQTANYGQRTLYAVEAPDVRFSDEGLTRLKDGVARVELDPIFLETIEGNYLVHVTPYSDASLYVAEVGMGYFVVRSRDGDAHAAFAWRLSAPRKGYADMRLEEVK